MSTQQDIANSATAQANSTPEQPSVASFTAQWARAYAELGLHPVQLHGVTADLKCTCGRSCTKSAGKHPVANGWQRAPLDLPALEAAIARAPNSNLGLRMGVQPDGTARVALDIDDTTAAGALEVKLGKLPATLTTVTARGYHCIYEVPADVLARMSCFVGRDGIDLRAEGGQVVSAPSRHYTGTHYRLLGNQLVRPVALPQAWLDWVLAQCQTKAANDCTPTDRTVDESSVPADEVWDDLVQSWAAIWPPTGRHELVMAVAGALGRGTWPDDAIAQFCVDVSEAAGAPADGVRDADLTARDRLRRLADGDTGYGVPRLRELLERAGVGLLDQIALTDGLVVAAGRVGFAELQHADGELRSARATSKAQAPDPRDVCRDRRKRPREFWVQLMNAHHCVLTAAGGKTRVLGWKDTKHGGREYYYQSMNDFANRYLPHTACIEGKDDPQSIGAWWLRQSDRREALDLAFRPDSKDELVDGHINTWRGYAVDAEAGDCSRYQALVHDVIAAGDAASYKYIWKWCAWVLQNPGKRAETVLVLKGKKGTGKGTFLDVLSDLFAGHSLMLTQANQLTGRFNAHLADKAFVYANEALPPNDKQAESVLKSLVTDSTFAVERKGLDIVKMPNILSLAMSSNEDWVVPVSLEDRRWAVFNVSDAHMQDHAYFEAIRAELANGGMAAFLHEMLTLDLGAWHPRKGIPATAAQVEQQLRSLNGAALRVYEMLSSGQNPGSVQVQGAADNGVPGSVFCATRTAADKFFGPKASHYQTAFGRELAKCCPEGSSASKVSCLDFGRLARIRGRWLPPLPEARALWEAAQGFQQPVTWPEDVQSWEGAED